MPLVNALVLHVGMYAVAQAQSKPAQPPMTQSAPMDIFQQLITDLDTEGPGAWGARVRGGSRTQADVRARVPATDGRGAAQAATCS